ncbi:MAG: hypothetical protein HPY58_05645 [Firmicutes bacterium]|nr:hypothetical protein [Bacillota bacterium]
MQNCHFYTRCNHHFNRPDCAKERFRAKQQELMRERRNKGAQLARYVRGGVKGPSFAGAAPVVAGDAGPVPVC